MLEESTLNLYWCHWDVAQFLQFEILIYSLKGYLSHFDPNIIRELIQLISTYVHNGIASKVPSKYDQDFSGQDWMAWWLGFIEKHGLLMPLFLTDTDHSISLNSLPFIEPQVLCKFLQLWLHGGFLDHRLKKRLNYKHAEQHAWYLLTYTCVLIPIKWII